MNTRVAGAMSVALIWGHAATAQSALLLRHEPVQDLRVRTVFQTVTRIDGVERVVEAADLGVMSGVALAGLEGDLVWHLAYDSLIIRTREAIGEWSEFSVPGAESVWAQVHLDDRQRVSGVLHGEPVAGITGLVGVLTGMPDLALPEGSLLAGETWSSKITTEPLGVISTVGSVPELPAVAVLSQLTLDSIVVRANDTLGYVSVWGRVQPTSIVTINGEHPSRLTLSGTLSGNLVWSTGWSLFVSGARRMSLRMERGAAGVQSEKEIITVVKTTRHQIRP
ncbi:MAG: hypothetical protein AMS18_00905 [Gemmatimonas sp. SG8_17]|nr:MAG: hypothetical protein AMS18_00905 [Gemmatimonas sp. SG8_17]